MERTIPKILREITQKYGDRPAQLSKDGEGNFQPTSYNQLYKDVSQAAAGLLSLGVKRGDHIGLISENRKEWLIADLCILSIGAADVPRGCDSTQDEIGYILGFSDCAVSFAETGREVDKIISVRDQIKNLNKIIVFDPAFNAADLKEKPKGIELLSMQDVLQKGAEYLGNDPEAIEKEIDQGGENDIATLIFTSGTTGTPKGVMLSHWNFLHQVKEVPDLIHTGPEDVWLCVLPVWHSFERIMQYVSLGAGSALAYSKPIGKIMLDDMEKIKPTWMASVPRIWESIRLGVYRKINADGGIKASLFHFFVKVGSFHAELNYRVRGLKPRFKKRIRFIDFIVAIIPYLVIWPLRALGNVLVFKKIKAKLGGNFIAGVSGGGALPAVSDKFFAAAGILLLEGYGLTETAPVIGVRLRDKPVPGTIGPILNGTEARIVDENGKDLPPGHKGLVLVKGPQVMLGYYNRPEETKKVLSDDGWLDTGDLGMLTYDNELKIMGRAKDTIVLLGGENIEPAPIEEKIGASEYIDQVVVLGQDQKFLAALIVPNIENLEEYAKSNGISYMDMEDLVTSPEINNFIRDYIAETVCEKTGFKGFERIFRFKILSKPFEVGKELSAKQEIKRHVIQEIYKKEIAELFK